MKQIKKIFRNFSIKKYCIVLMISVLLIIFVFQIVCMLIFNSWIKKIADEIFDYFADSIVLQINNIHTNLEDIVLRFVSQSIIQETVYSLGLADKAKNMQKIIETIRNSMLQDTNISFFSIVEKGKITFYDSFESESSLYMLANEIISELDDNVEDSFFSDSYMYNNKVYFAYIYRMFPLNTFSHNESNYVVLLYSINLLNILPSDTDKRDMMEVIITDHENNIMISSNLEQYGQIYDSYNNKNLSRITELINPNWKIFIAMPVKFIVNTNVGIIVFFSFMIVIDAILCLMMNKVLFNTIVKRIGYIKSNINKIVDINNQIRMEVQYEDEFKEIAVAINDMLDRIDLLNKEKIEISTKLNKAHIANERMQIYYLRSQVAPHFLYNSMAYIQSIARKNNIWDITNITAEMSKVFRYYTNNAVTSTIGEDLNYALSYFNVINIRRTNPIIINIDIDESILNIPIIKMVFQPLFENIHKHAFTTADTDCIVNIGYEDISYDYGAIYIRDNGVGIEKNKLDKIKFLLKQSVFDDDFDTVNHVGLVNVNMRLKMFHKCGIEIDSVYNEGTTVKVIIPKEK